MEGGGGKKEFKLNKKSTFSDVVVKTQAHGYKSYIHVQNLHFPFTLYQLLTKLLSWLTNKDRNK